LNNVAEGAVFRILPGAVHPKKETAEMKSLSTSVLALAPSMTVAIDTRAKELQAAGQDVVGLGAGEPDFDTPDYIKEAAIASLRAGKTKYTPPTGIPELKRAVADKLLRENNVSVDPAQVVVTSGVKHAVNNVLQTVLNPGDEVLIPAPYWVTYPELVKLYGGVPVFLPTSVATGYKITPAQLEAAITPTRSTSTSSTTGASGSPSPPWAPRSWPGRFLSTASPRPTP
jgi:aspartate aminotransferase